MGSNTKIAQVNVHHAKAASAVVARTFAKQQLGLALIQEPWVYRRQVKGLYSKDAKVIWDVRQDSPRACIMIRASINYFSLSEFMTRDLVAIQTLTKVGGNDRQLVIASAYFAGDGDQTPPIEVQKLIKYCNSKKLPLLIGCDANAHNWIWGSNDTNQRGEYLLEFILKENLEIFNVGSTPTFVTRVREEVLDITFGTSSLNRVVRNWRVSDEPSMSDHRIIMFDLSDELTVGDDFIRNPRKTNWEGYKTSLRENLEQLIVKRGARHPLELEIAVEELNRAIVEAYERNCPVKAKKKLTDADWWTEELSELRNKVRKSFNGAKRNGNWQEYSRALTAYNIAIRSAKRRSFRNFCESIAATSQMARIHKAMAKNKVEERNSLKKPDGSFTENEEQRARLLLETHFPGSQDQNVEETVEFRKPLSTDWRIASEICTEERLDWAISAFQPYKTPGVDGIFPALLQKGKRELMIHLIRITRSSLALGYIPKTWRRARVTFIPKVGKKENTHPKSFRPISLTSFLLKTLEKVVDNYIRSAVLEKLPLHHSQHAYRAGRSTDTALYQLTSKIEEALDSKETALCAFLDIEGAFDNTSHKAVEKALERRKVNTTALRWVGELLGTRRAETQVGQNTITVKTTRGCPQGGVLSPLLWSLVIDELLEELNNHGIDSQGYADDIVIIARGKFEETLCDIIQSGLKTTKEWCTKVGLSLNPRKTTVVPFTRKRKLQHIRPIKLNGEEIMLEKEVKFLGVILDSKLLWKRHMEVVVNKATRALMVCRSLAGKTWGCNPSILRWMYTMMVRPIITYGAVAWARRSQLTTERKALGKVQRLACICMTGAMRTCPTAAMEVIMGLTPLHLVIQRTAVETILRISREGVGRNKVISLKECDSLSRNIPLLKLPKDNMVKKYCFERNFTTKLNTKRNWSSDPSSRQLDHYSIKWYTDGSKTSEGTGAGVYGPRTKYFEPMGCYPSIFQAEVHAIERCAQFNIDRKYKKTSIAILSDSQAAIKALNSYEVSSKTVWDCLIKLNELGKENRVVLHWVPGHTGVKGNEEADKLAKRGSETPFTGPEPFSGIGTNTIRATLDSKEKNERERLWREHPKLRQSKELLGTFDQKRTADCLKLSKNKLRILTGFLTGHCRLRGHLKKLGLEEIDICRFCESAEETPAHLLKDCGALIHKRKRIWGAYCLLSKELPSLETRQILSFLEATGLEKIL